MRIAIFGGTFDPVHAGHVRAARAAARKFRLDKVLLVPACRPPHKRTEELTSFEHRYAMVALACAGNARLAPSLLEGPDAGTGAQFSVDTVSRLRRHLGRRDKLFLILGADAFLDLPHWKSFQRLMSLAEFIVVSRPGYEEDKILKAAHAETAGAKSSPRRRTKPGAIHILDGVHVAVSASEIRAAVRSGRKVTGSVPRLVEQYIRKVSLYRPQVAGGQ